MWPDVTKWLRSFWESPSAEVFNGKLWKRYFDNYMPQKI